MDYEPYEMPPNDWAQLPSWEELPIKLRAKYVCDFSPINQGPVWSGSEWVFLGIMIERSVIDYHNSDLASAMSLAEWACRSEVAERERFYLLEDAVSRHCACWEYLFQVLVHVVGINEEVLPTRASLEEILGLHAYDIEYVDRGNESLSVEYLRRDRATAVRAIREVRGRLDYLRTGSRADQFFSEVDSRYVRGSWLDAIREQVRDHPVKKVRDLRNTAAHSNHLGARFRVSGVGGPLPGNGLRMHAPPADSTDVILNTLRQAHKRLGKAIALTVQAVETANIPNSKRNEGAVFEVGRRKCPECASSTPTPRPDPCVKHFNLHYCHNCGGWFSPSESPITESSKTPEWVYASMLRQRLEKVTRGVASYPGGQAALKAAGVDQPPTMGDPS